MGQKPDKKRGNADTPGNLKKKGRGGAVFERVKGERRGSLQGERKKKCQIGRWRGEKNLPKS